MPLQHARTFLLVALEEGLGVKDYTERAGVGQTVKTKTLARHRHDDVVTQRPDPMDTVNGSLFVAHSARNPTVRVVQKLGVKGRSCLGCGGSGSAKRAPMEIVFGARCQINRCTSLLLVLVAALRQKLNAFER